MTQFAAYVVPRYTTHMAIDGILAPSAFKRICIQAMMEVLLRELPNRLTSPGWSRQSEMCQDAPICCARCPMEFHVYGY